MKFKDMYKGVRNSLVKMGFGFKYEDAYAGGKGGEVFIRLEHEDGTVEERHIENVITRDFSILAARLAKDPLEPRNGIFALSVGSGDTGWDLQNPPGETNTQRSLYAEIGRKGFSDTAFIDSGGSTTVTPTNIVDFTATFAESEAVGAIVEMGLVGGDVNEDTAITSPITPANGAYDASVDVTGKDTLINYLTFPVINKPATARLTITWRITF